MSDAGVDDGAILLMSLGEEEAAAVFKHLPSKEAQKVGAAMAKLKNVTREKIDGVLERFLAQANGQTTIGIDSDDYIRGVLNKALGADKAKFLLDRILQGQETSGIESLKWMDARAIAELIKNEHPQIIASILVHLERDQAADILNQLGEKMSGDVILRIATLDGIHPAALRELNDVISKVLSGGDQIKKAPMGGVRAILRISFCSASTSDRRTGPFDSRSSRNVSAARLDMLRKIFSRNSGTAPFRARIKDSDCTSLSSA